MILAADTSTLSAYILNEPGEDVDALDRVFATGGVALPPVVLTEVLCAKYLTPAFVDNFRDIPLLEILDGYWERAGKNRAKLHKHGLKAGLADSLIAQACIDHDVPLITRDRDFRHFSKHCALKLAVKPR
ncbi:MAG: PIN domain-containing protein [Bdellovibrionota bacterium]